MLNTYIKNRGITQTIIHNNNHNHFNEINWDAYYDGNLANISVNSNTDGKHNQINFSLDNHDLANLLNIPSVNIPIDKRLKLDFQEPSLQQPYLIELPNSISKSYEPELIVEPTINRHISSPQTNEELIIPLTIDRKTKNKYTLTPKKRHRRHKTHITHKVYKKPKTISKSKSKSRTKSKSVRTYIDLL